MNNLKIIKGDLFEAVPTEEAHFTRLYLRLRKKEGRIYTNKQLKTLPCISPSHRYYKEWKVRKYSCEKLLGYIRKHRQISNILEVGCGNGWLTAQLSKVAKDCITGVDINSIELEQARKVFGDIPQISFIEGDIRSGILEDRKFDMIVFAASIQYFPSLKEIINVALSHLTLQGEIHIIDSHFYRPNQLLAAKERSRRYFMDAGFPGMIHFYFHHTLNELALFRYHFFNNPFSWVRRIKSRRMPFHWIVIENNKT